MNLLKKKSGIKRKSHYNSIYDLPIYNWYKMRKLNDLSFLFKDKSKHKSELTEEQQKYLTDVYLDMLTEFFDEFGQTKDFKKELKLKSEIIDLRLEYASTGDEFILNDLEMLESELLKKQADNIDKDLNIDEDEQMKIAIAYVGKLLGHPIDTREVSVLQFYTQLVLRENTLN